MGAYQDSPGGVTRAGSAYVFDGVTGDLLYALPNPDPEFSDRFGNWVSIQDGRVAVSAQRDNSGGVLDAGSVYVYDLFPSGVSRQVSGRPSTGLVLRPNAPNPFNPSTTLRFVVPGFGAVHLTIHDLHGRHIRTLGSGSGGPGEHTRSWDGRDSRGRLVASGVYYARLEQSGEVVTRRITVLR